MLQLKNMPTTRTNNNCNYLYLPHVHTIFSVSLIRNAAVEVKVKLYLKILIVDIYVGVLF